MLLTARRGHTMEAGTTPATSGGAHRPGSSGGFDTQPSRTVFLELVKISNGILYEPVAEPLHKVIRAMTRIIVKSNGAVLTVATAGYGNDAVKIVLLQD